MLERFSLKLASSSLIPPWDGLDFVIFSILNISNFFRTGEYKEGEQALTQANLSDHLNSEV